MCDVHLMNGLNGLNNKHYFLAFVCKCVKLGGFIVVSCNKIAWGHVQCYKYSIFLFLFYAQEVEEL